MNTQSNALPESFESQRIVPATTSATRPFYWSVRRELWEYRSIYIAPLAGAAVALFGFLIAIFVLSVANAPQRRPVLEDPYGQAAALIMMAAFIVSIFYSLEALHSERRDRSILFWKSLPVSDLTTVLSKASVPLVLLPVMVFVLTVAVQLIMLLVNGAVLLLSGASSATPWAPPVLEMG